MEALKWYTRIYRLTNNEDIDIAVKLKVNKRGNKGKFLCECNIHNNSDFKFVYYWGFYFGDISQSLLRYSSIS
jgi:hypothetical protein